MKHNQFKHIISKLIKDKCAEYNFKLGSVDRTSTDKVIYIYDSQYNCKLSIVLWVGTNEVHLSASSDKQKVAHPGNRTFDCRCSYLEFNKIYDMLNCMFEIIKD